MIRLTILAIALAGVACSGGDSDRVADGSAAAGADTAMTADAGMADTAMAPDTRTPEGGTGDARTARDTGRTGTARTSSGQPAPSGPSGAEAMGGVRSATAAPAAGTARTPRDLSAAQVRRLQTALNDAGCNAGPVDGVVGTRTRQAITCGLERNNLRRDDYAGLYRALDLSF